MFCALWVERFILQAALRWRDAADALGPVAAVDGEAAKSFVAEACADAEADGVRPGLGTAAALARCPGLRFVARSRASEDACGHALVAAALRRSPSVESSAPGLCLLDLRRVSRAACWQRAGAAMRGELARCGLAVRAGFAPNADHALMAARWGRDDSGVSVVYDGAQFCAPLPVEALDPEPAAAAILAGWGVRTVGDLLRLPEAEAASRLGRDAARMWRRARGRDRRVLRLVRERPAYAEAFDFEGEVSTAEPVLFLLRRFVDGLCARLRADGRVAAGMRLELPLDDGSVHAREFGIPEPTGDADVLYRVLETHVGCVRLGRVPSGVRLALRDAAPTACQLDLFERALADPNRFGETLARLRALLGERAVGVPARGATYRPDAYALGDFRVAESPGDPPTGWSGDRWSRLPGLPLRRFRPPRPADVRVAGGVPAEVECAAFRGRAVRARGPFRASGAWWDQSRWEVEEWDVELEGGSVLRLSREGAGWSVAGTYDEAPAAARQANR